MAQKAARPMIYHELNAKSETSQTMVGDDLFTIKVIEFQNIADPGGVDMIGWSFTVWICTDGRFNTAKCHVIH